MNNIVRFNEKYIQKQEKERGRLQMIMNNMYVNNEIEYLAEYVKDIQWSNIIFMNEQDAQRRLYVYLYKFGNKTDIRFAYVERSEKQPFYKIKKNLPESLQMYANIYYGPEWYTEQEVMSLIEKYRQLKTKLSPEFEALRELGFVCMG